MKSEHYLAIIAGLLILAYVLDAVVNPLAFNLATPYEYFTPTNLSLYPFSTVSIILKSLAMVLAPLWIMSLISIHPTTKGIAAIILSGLLQLYAIQDIVTGAQVVTLEWSLAFTLTGMILLIPATVYFITGMFKHLHTNISGDFGESWDDLEEEDKKPLKRLKN